MGCIAVFAKPPVAGQVKTRLGRVIGHEAAAELAQALLRDSVEQWQATGHPVVVATTDPTAEHGLDGAVPAMDQGPGGLGRRIERVLRAGLREHPWTMAVGADAPAIPQAAIQQALDALQSGRDVLGPTDDGGFWALGLHQCPDGLLAELPWSDPTTCARTRERLVAWGLTPIELPRAWDVDRPEDLQQLSDAGDLAPRSAAIARRILEGTP